MVISAIEREIRWDEILQGGRAYLSNDLVAWEIPRGRISAMYQAGFYEPPPDWLVVTELAGEWRSGACGELRRMD